MKYTRNMNNASNNESSSPLFAKSSVLELKDLQNLQICRLMCDVVHDPIAMITRPSNDPKLPNVKYDLARRLWHPQMRKCRYM